MAAPTGNLNAEKWTVEALCPLLDEIEELASQTTTYFIGSLLVRFRISRKAWSYWRKKFETHPQISDQMEFIEGILEQRLVDDALEGKIRTTVALFCLRCHHSSAAPAPPPSPQEPATPPSPPVEPEPEPIRVEMPDGSFLVFPCGIDRRSETVKDISATPRNIGPDNTG